MRFKNISGVCLIYYFIFVAVHAVYMFVALDSAEIMALGISTLVFFSTYATLASLKPTRKLAPHIFSVLFPANCFIAALVTPIASILPIIFLTAGIILGFFLKPQCNLFLLASSDVIFLVTLFLTNASVLVMPFPVFVAVFVIYNVAMIGLIGLIFNFRRKINENRKKITRLVNTVNRQDLFISGIAQNITASLRNSDALCAEILRISPNEAERENASEIKRINKQIHNVISSTNDYISLETRKLRIENDVYTFSSFLSDLVSLCSVKIKNTKAVDFIVDVADNIPYSLIGDFKKIIQAVLNVFANAAQYTRSGSITLSISTRKTEYGVNLNIEVADTGMGIKPEIADKLFTAYTDSANSIHLGLGIAKQLVTLMGGFISLSTEQNVGTTIKISIPQGVKNFEPFVVKNTKKASVLMLIGAKHLRPHMEKLFRQAGAELIFCESNAEFMVEKERTNLTHIFADYGSYIYNKPYFDLLSKRVALYVIKEADKKEDTLPREIRRLYYPLNILSLSLVFGGKPQKQTSHHFTAPDAKVLVVDDNPVNIKLAYSFLSTYEVRLSKAESGYQAVEMARSEHYDLIILDHLMPGMNGAEAAEIIRKNSLCMKTPIIAFTVDVGEPTDTELMTAGINDMLSKPLEPLQLDAILEKWLPSSLIRYSQSPKRVVDNYLDISAGLRNFSDEIAFLNALESFHNSIELTEASLLRALAEFDFRTYANICSSIKDSAERICAQSVYDQARLLESTAAGASPSALKEQHRLLITLYLKTNSCIEKYFSDKNIDLYNLISLSDALPRIRQAIKQKDSKTSYELIKLLLSYSLAPAVREALEKTLDAIDSFDFELAHDVIKKLKNTSEKNAKKERNK